MTKQIYNCGSKACFSYLAADARTNMERAANIEIAQADRYYCLERAKSAVHIMLMLREAPQQPGANELGLFDHASQLATKILETGDILIFSDLEERLRVVSGLTDIMITLIEALEPDDPASNAMEYTMAQLAGQMMALAHVFCDERPDYMTYMPWRSEADLVMSAAQIASKLSHAIEEQWRRGRAKMKRDG